MQATSRHCKFSSDYPGQEFRNTIGLATGTRSELAKRKGNKIFGLNSKKVEKPEEYLGGIAVVVPDQSLLI